MPQKNTQPTNQDILRSINDFSTQMDQKITKMDQKMATKKDLEKFATKEELKSFSTKEDLKKFATKGDLAKLETRLVTKSYLDDKLADQYSDLVDLMRKEDAKIKALI